MSEWQWAHLFAFSTMGMIWSTLNSMDVVRAARLSVSSLSDSSSRVRRATLYARKQTASASKRVNKRYCQMLWIACSKVAILVGRSTSMGTSVISG